MTEDRIKEGLKAAVKDITPNMLDNLMAELEINDEPKENLADAIKQDAASYAIKDGAKKDENWTPKWSKKWMRTALASAAALLFVFGAMTMLRSKPVMALVSLDVNPSIEISIDKDERVISAEPINSEGEEILGEMDLKGSDIDVACNAIVGSMLTHGYLSNISNSILLSVSAEDETLGKDIEKRLTEELNAYLENTEIASAILGQYVNNDESLRAFASENGISLGKAWLIKNLMATGSARMTEADLLSLSTQELIYLGQKRGAQGSVSYGSAETEKYIGSDKAISIALEKAGVDKTSASYIRYELDCEDGVLIYEVEFIAGDYEYEYEINAYDGSVVSYKKEYEGPTASASAGSGGSQENSGGAGSSSKSSGGSGSGSSGISSDKAISIALGSAGVSRSSASKIKCEVDYENGVKIYEVEFRAGDYEYEYDIKASDGSIISYDKDYEGPSSSSKSNSKTTVKKSNGSSGGNSGSSKSKHDDDDDDDDDDEDDD